MLLSTAALLAALLAPTATAQTEAVETPEARELPEVIVTAQKTEQTLQDVPASVSTLSGDFISEIGAFDFTDLEGYTPNLAIRLTPTTSDLYIRGFGTPSTNAGFEPSVAAVIDGVYYGRSPFLAVFLHDLDRIEILRGPQGTLFGKNTTAGVLNIVTAPPREEFEAKAELLYGNYGETSLRPAISTPLLVDGLSLRLTGNYSRNDGVIVNTALNRPEGNIDQDTTRLRLRYEADAGWLLDLGGFHSDQRLNNNVFQLSEVSDAMLAFARSYDPETEDSAANFLTSSNVPAAGDVSFDGVNLTFEMPLDGWFGAEKLSFTSISAIARSKTHRREFDADFTAAPVILVSQIEPARFRQFSQELRFSGRYANLLGMGREFNFLVGGYYYDARLHANDFFGIEDLGAAFGYLLAAQAGTSPLGAPVGFIGGTLAPPLGVLVRLLDPALAPALGEEQSAFVRLNQAGTADAAFGQAEWWIAPRWALIGGLRVGGEKKTGISESKSNGRLIPLIADQEDHSDRLSRNEGEVSPKAGLKWQPSDDLNVYATWGQGRKSGGLNAFALNADNLEFEPERATSIELGTKAQLLGGSMRLSATLFTTDFEDLQVSTFRGASFIILNAAEARSRGLELDLQWLPPLPGTMLISSLGYLRARYTRYPNAPAPADAEQPTQDLAGRPLTYAPRWTGSLIPSYTLNLADSPAALNFALELLYRDERYLDVDLDPRTLQPATTEVNARMTLGTFTEDWSFTVGAHNLTDEVILEQVLDQPLAAGNFAAIRADRGRYYTANLSLIF